MIQRKLSHIPAINLTERVIVSTFVDENGICHDRYQQQGIKAYDLLALDKVSNSPCLPGRNNTLLYERYEKDPHAKIRVSNPYNESAVRHVLAGGTHPLVNRRAYLEENSMDNVLLPTAANELCFKCGLTINCICHKPIRGKAKPIYQEFRTSPEQPKRIKIAPVSGLDTDIFSPGAQLNDMLQGLTPRAELWICEV